MRGRLARVVLTTAVTMLLLSGTTLAASLKVSPGVASADQLLTPGHSVTLPTYTVDNSSDLNMTVEVFVSDYEHAEKKRPPSGWFSIAPSEFSLEKGSHEKVVIEVSVPHDADAGEYSVYFRFTGTPIGASGFLQQRVVLQPAFVFEVKALEAEAPEPEKDEPEREPEPEPEAISRFVFFTDDLTPEKQQEILESVPGLSIVDCIEGFSAWEVEIPEDQLEALSYHQGEVRRITEEADFSAEPPEEEAEETEEVTAPEEPEAIEEPTEEESASFTRTPWMGIVAAAAILGGWLTYRRRNSGKAG